MKTCSQENFSAALNRPRGERNASSFFFFLLFYAAVVSVGFHAVLFVVPSPGSAALLMRSVEREREGDELIS